ncbi:uncharacterized protein si:dkey-87o1.2 [Pungitius pungitius]|uniref:uncharacterized protein si:dkey-87o1.2 n=1 Tax=Pungitius pungitius TaxID=134920 RepID=UPI002E14976F
MKAVVVLCSLSVAAMCFLIYQAARQELNIHHLKTRMLTNVVEVRMKEESIIELQHKINDLKTASLAINAKIDGLKKKKEESNKSKAVSTETLKNCNKEREATQKRKAEKEEAIVKLKADHEVAKQKAKVDIQALKQQILDRDKAICAFADTTKDEARKLCGIAEIQ